jgi:hypothetical protein
MRKCTVLVLITCLAVSSLMMILPVSIAQTKPATPTFTIEYPAIIDFARDGLILILQTSPSHHTQRMI